MNIYVRRVDNQCINKQISILKETVKNFFDDKESVLVEGVKSTFMGTVTILLATDPRLGGDIKRIIKEEGDMSEGDLLLFTKKKNKYLLEIVKKSDDRYKLLTNMFEDVDKHLEMFVEKSNENSNDSNDLIGYNKIFYGIPGCGKSYYVENTILDGVDKEHDVFRTTFYLDYSNTDFIGQIYPSVDDDGNVSYIRVPGPFTEALEQAIKNPDRMIYLVIEEINRGNAAAIFGDMFQLLDRLSENKNSRVIGDSEYPVSNTFIEGYFKAHNIPYTPGQIYIPHNLTLLATMNTSDQNVFPLDTAFKRRWDRRKVVTNWDDAKEIGKLYIPYSDITWKEFATTINECILNSAFNSDVSISEDKQMGSFFAQKSMLTETPNEVNKDALITFTSNVIDYLYNDVTKFDHSLLFDEKLNSYDKLYNKIENHSELNGGVFDDVFNKNIINKLSVYSTMVSKDEQGTEN